MESRYGSPSVLGYVEAFCLLREAALYMIISSLLIGIGFVVVIATVAVTWFMASPRPSIHISTPGHPISTTIESSSITMSITPVLLVITMFVVLVVGAILALYALFGKLLPATSRLKNLDPEFGTSETLIKIGFLVGLLLLVMGVVTAIVFIGIPLIFAAKIMLIIGLIGIAIMCFKMNSRFGSTTFLIAGILFILSIIVPILDFIAWILVYVESGTLIEKLQRQQSL